MTHALIIIDMQNGYFKSDEDRAALPALTQSIIELIKIFKSNNQPVVFAKTVHAADKSTWTRKMKETNDAFCIEGSEEAHIVEGLRDIENEGDNSSLAKTRDNAFLNTDLEAQLKSADIDTVVLAGVSTHQCVAATGLDAAQRDFQVIIASDCVHSPEAADADCVTSLLVDEYGAREALNDDIEKVLASS